MRLDFGKFAFIPPVVYGSRYLWFSLRCRPKGKRLAPGLRNSHGSLRAMIRPPSVGAFFWGRIFLRQIESIVIGCADYPGLNEHLQSRG